MSKSYKRTPILKQKGCFPKGKQMANRKVRYYAGMIADGKMYKKISESWDIYEYVDYNPWKQFYKSKYYNGTTYWQWYKGYLQK